MIAKEKIKVVLKNEHLPGAGGQLPVIRGGHTWKELKGKKN